MNKNVFFLVTGLFFSLSAISQNVSINATGTVPDNSAMLDVAANDKGVLVPRMSVADRNNINAPANGLIVYNTDCNLLNYYDCDTWRDVRQTFGFPNQILGSEVITGNQNPSENESGVFYSVPPITGASTYSWTVPGGATIVSGSGTNEIVVDFSAPGHGYVCVSAINSCGTEVKACLFVDICALTATPVATAATNITDTDFDANWQAANGATDYYLDVSDDVNFNNLIVNNLNVGNTTSYNVSGLICGITYYYRVRAENACVTTVNSNDITITVDYCSSYTLCGGGTMTFNDVFNPVTGETWMDRNLGASQVAASSTDANSYGDLFQWGREADGHQCRTSGTTSTRSSSDSPGHGNFITYSSPPSDWRNPQNDNLWQGVNGTNNPCPPGYRLPTDAELDAERASWSTNNAAGAFGSPLKLPLGGRRSSSSGSLSSVGSGGRYWSGTVSGIYARRLFFNSGGASMDALDRADGSSVRCLKD